MSSRVTLCNDLLNSSPHKKQENLRPVAPTLTDHNHLLTFLRKGTDQPARTRIAVNLIQNKKALRLQINYAASLYHYPNSIDLAILRPMTKVLSSKDLVLSKVEQLKNQCQKLISSGRKPRLDVVLVGSNPASLVYVGHKKKKCELIGIECIIHQLDEHIEENDFLKQVEMISNNPLSHGSFIQLPLPKQLKHIDTASLVDPAKDVDGFHPDNMYGATLGFNLNQYLLPCTPKGILSLFDHYNIDLEGKNIVVIGRSMIVGKPIGLMCLARNATVTYCHSKTHNLKEFTSLADVIIVAIGKSHFLTAEYINPNKAPYIIDVGMNRLSDGTLAGDAHFEQLLPLVKGITPVPGGVGPLTVISLMENTLMAANAQ